MKYKKFFGIPLYRLPFRLPKRKVIEKKIKGKKLQIQGNLQRYDLEELIKILMLYTTSRNRRPMRIVFITNKINVGRAYLSSVYESFDDLDSVYGNLASEIPIKTERKKGLSLPVVGYGYENFDPAEHDASKINFKRIVADSASPFNGFVELVSKALSNQYLMELLKFYFFQRSPYLWSNNKLLSFKSPFCFKGDFLFNLSTNLRIFL
jgi:hypothetical protein